MVLSVVDDRDVAGATMPMTGLTNGVHTCGISTMTASMLRSRISVASRRRSSGMRRQALPQGADVGTEGIGRHQTGAEPAKRLEALVLMRDGKHGFQRRIGECNLAKLVRELGERSPRPQ